MKSKYLVPLMFSVLVALACGFASCDNGCEQNRENFMHVSFTSSSGRVLRGMEIILTSNDTTGYMITDIKDFSNLELDLNPNDSVTCLFISSTYTDFGDSFQLIDTIRIDYTTQAYYLDMNCGCTVHYELQSVLSTHHLFHSVEVVDPLVLPDTQMNLRFEY